MAFEFQIAFTTLTCDECDRTWFANEDPCNCGIPEVTSDLHVETRRQLVWNSSPTAPTRSVEPVLGQPPPELWNKMAELMDLLIEAVQTIAAETEEGSTRLRTALTELRDRGMAVEGAQWFRPWWSHWRAVERVLGDIERAVSEYLLALTSDTAPESQHHAAAAQVALDTAGEQASAYADVIGLWEAVDDAPLDPLDVLPALAAAAYESSGAASLLELDQAGAQVYTRITGKTDVEVGVGLGLEVTRFVASVLFDERAFWSKAALAFDLLSADLLKTAALASDHRWLSDYEEAAAEMRDALVEAAVLSAAATHHRLEVRAAVRLGARLFEPIARPLLVPLLVIGKKRDLARFITKDPNVVVKQLRDAGFGALCDGLLAAMRDADSHNRYRLDGDTIALTSSRAEVREVTAPELLDIVLAGLETVHALHAALTCAFLEAGVAADALPETNAWDFTWEQKLRLVLGSSGWTEVDVSKGNDAVEVTGYGDFPENPITLGGACMSALDDSISQLVLRARTVDGTHTLRMQLAVFRQHQSAEDAWEKDALFLEACTQATYHSKPLFSRVQVRKWIAMKAGEALTSSDAPRRLHVLLALAERTQDRAIGKSLEAAIRIRAAEDQCAAVNPADLASLKILSKWERRRL
jgi:hypothetical protein